MEREYPAIALKQTSGLVLDVYPQFNSRASSVVVGRGVVDRRKAKEQKKKKEGRDFPHPFA